MSLETGPETFYGLSGRAFALAPDHAFFFDSNVHRRVLDYLEDGVYQADGFILVTGEVGAGKTTLVGKLLSSLEPSKVLGVHLVSTLLNGEETLRFVSGAFGLHAATRNKTVLRGRFERFLRNQSEEGKRTLLIVDEAQNLSRAAFEELRVLSNFQGADGSLIQIFLVGQPELRQILAGADMSQVRQRVVAACHLPALDPSDTRAYIEHRLRKVDWHGDPTFDENAVEEIHAFTGGVPRRINTLCQRLLLLGFIEDKHAMSIEEVRTVIDEIRSEMAFGESTPAAVYLPVPNGSMDMPLFFGKSASGIESPDPLSGLLDPRPADEKPEANVEIETELSPSVEPDSDHETEDEGQEVAFVFPDAGASHVQVSGSWDQWSVRTTMEGDGAGWFRARIRLKGEGPYAYKFVIDEKSWLPDPSNPERVYDGYDGDNSVLRLPPPQAASPNP